MSNRRRPTRRPWIRSARSLLPWLLPWLLASGPACGKRGSEDRAAPKTPAAAPSPGTPATPDASPTPDVAPTSEATLPPPADPPRPSAPPQVADVRCVAGPPATPAPELPEGALVLMRTRPPQGPDTGFRVLADGNLETLAADGSWALWRQLTATELEAVRRLAGESPLDGLAPSYRVAEPAGPVRSVWLLARGTDGVRAVAYDEPCFLSEVHELLLGLLKQFH